MHQAKWGSPTLSERLGERNGTFGNGPAIQRNDYRAVIAMLVNR